MDVGKTTSRPRILFELSGELTQILAVGVCVCSKWSPQLSVIAAGEYSNCDALGGNIEKACELF